MSTTSNDTSNVNSVATAKEADIRRSANREGCAFIDLAHLPPIRQCVTRLGLGERPDWDLWKTMTQKEQSLAFAVLVELKHMPSLLGYMEHVCDKEQLAQWHGKYYFFPSDITFKEWRKLHHSLHRSPHLNKADQSSAVTWLFGYLVNTAKDCNKPEVLEWITKTPDYKKWSKIISDDLWYILERSQVEEVAFGCVKALMKLGHYQTEIKEKEFELLVRYEKEMLLESTHPPKTTSKPKVM